MVPQLTSAEIQVHYSVYSSILHYKGLLHPFLQQKSGHDDDQDEEETPDHNSGDGAAGETGFFGRLVGLEDGRQLDGIRKLARLVGRVVGLHGQVVDGALVEPAPGDFEGDQFSGFNWPQAPGNDVGDVDGVQVEPVCAVVKVGQVSGEADVVGGGCGEQ